MKRKTTVKGFTLIEMIVVVATFSIIMIAAMNLMLPSRKLFDRSYSTESMISSAAQVHTYLEETLRYASSIQIQQTTPTKSDLITFVDNTYRSKLVLDNLTAAPKRYEGKFYVLDIDNTPDAKGNTGQIRKWVYDFKAGGLVELKEKTELDGKKSYWSKDIDTTITPDAAPAIGSSVLCLNQGIFNEMNFTISLGVFDAKANPSGDAIYYTLEKNANYYSYNSETFAPDNFGFTITTYPKRIPNTEAKVYKNALSIDQTQTRFANPSGGAGYAFYKAANYSSSISFENMVSAHSSLSGARYITFAKTDPEETDAAYGIRLDADGDSVKYTTGGPVNNTTLFRCNSFTAPTAAPDHIYIIYSYSDNSEIH